MSKKGLPIGIAMRHDSHYVEELSKPNKSIGKIISINLLEPNPEQPRVEIGELEELSLSIEEKGILEPILVKPLATGNYLIIAGERRWRAANLAGLREVPCIELDLDEQSIAEIALIENLQRKDLTIWEEADGLASLKNKFNYKHEDIAKKISKSRSTVTELLSVAGIPDNIRAQCRELNINSKSTLLEVARQFDEPAMLYFLHSYGENKKLIKQADKPAKKIKADRPAQAFRKLTGRDAENFGENISESKSSSGDRSLSESELESENIFQFVSRKNEFNLQIVFNNLQRFDKKNVLRALKESFDEIKASL